MGFVVQAPAIQDALGTAIADALSEDAATFSVGYPTGGPDEEDVWISGDFNAAFPRRTSGGGARDEEAALKVKILVTHSDDMTSVRDRAVDLSELVEDAVSDDPTLGGLTKDAHVSGLEGNEGFDKDGRRQFGMTMTVAYRTTASSA